MKKKHIEIGKKGIGRTAWDFQPLPKMTFSKLKQARQWGVCKIQLILTQAEGSEATLSELNQKHQHKSGK